MHGAAEADRETSKVLPCTSRLSVTQTAVMLIDNRLRTGTPLILL
jgi:hypothetical protein